jgi:hypothetical protein
MTTVPSSNDKPMALPIYKQNIPVELRPHNNSKEW